MDRKAGVFEVIMHIDAKIVSSEKAFRAFG